MKREDLKYDLSICMIVKNEEIYLKRCLNALLPLKKEISCEIIITDTGSTDKTIEIAKKYADTLLHFEWCDDFSKARNTGIEVSTGAWFLFIDANEIFDESVIEIAKFIKSKDRDKYDNANYFIRNIKNDVETNNIGCMAKRLFNFTQNKRYFKGKIHESIGVLGSIFEIKTTADHYVYHEDILQTKLKRNKELISRELKISPNDIKIMSQLYDVSSNDEKLKQAKEIIEIIEDDRDNDYKNLKNIDFAPNIYLKLIMLYLILGENDLAIGICEKYFKTSLIQKFDLEEKLPTLEIYLMYGFAFYNNKNYQDAVKYFLKYVELYSKLKVRPDTIFGTMQPYIYYNEHEYTRVLNTISNCYDKLDDAENLAKHLSQYKIYEYQDNNKQYIYLNPYFDYVCKYNQAKLIQNVIDFLKDKEDLNDSYSVKIFYAKLLLGDIDDYLKNCNASGLIQHVTSLFYETDISKLSQIYKIVKNKTEYTNLKEMVTYLKLMELFILNKSKTILNNEDRVELNEIFEIYVKKMYLYVKTSYNNNILNSEQFEILKPQELFGFIIYPALEQKQSNQVEYIKILKEGLKYSSQFKDVIFNVIELIQLNNTNNTPEPNSEFKLLSEKIKLAIIEAIKANDMEKAKTIIDEYKKINSTDPDIANLLNIIND